MFVRVLLCLSFLSFPGALRAEAPPAERPGFASRLTIYLAKGAPDACGPGCDRWIAIEGQIDQDAAARIRRFLAGVKDTQRPIYLHSPGGNVEQSYAIGRLLRSRKAIARVGRTIATACAAGTQIDAACLKIKNATGEVEAEITTYHAMCNSACGYLFLGATSREVAPDAALAVHDSRLILKFQGNPPPELLAEARRRRIAGAERDRAAFIAAMGISRELDALIRTVKFENLHVLTRAELYRFGIDTRPLAETTWRLDKGTRPFISKIAAVKKESDASFRTMEWRLYCESKKRVPLMFAGEIDAAATGKKSILMAASADLSKAAGGPPVRFGKYEVWNGAVDPDMVKAVLASQSLQIKETTPEPEGRDITSFNIDVTGLATVWTQLGTSCTSAAAGPAKAWPANALKPTPWTDSPWAASGTLPNVSATPTATSAP